MREGFLRRLFCWLVASAGREREEGRWRGEVADRMGKSREGGAGDVRHSLSAFVGALLLATSSSLLLWSALDWFGFVSLAWP